MARCKFEFLSDIYDREIIARGQRVRARRYLYPTDYFEPFLMSKGSSPVSPTTIYLDEYMKGILHAEAVASDKSVSALVREWLEERLDLPVPL